MKFALSHPPSLTGRLAQTGIGMFRDRSQFSRPRPPMPRQGDRRRINALKGIPLTGGLGLVFNDRRSYRERRSKRRKANPAPPCALLQQRDPQPAPGFLGNLSPGLSASAIGAWLKRCLGYAWRARIRRPAGRP